jgi:hypothetical protein
MELRDAVTGTLLARALDHKSGSDMGRLQWSNSVMNRAESESALRSWADRLNRGLDATKARGSGGSPDLLHGLARPASHPIRFRHQAGCAGSDERPGACGDDVKNRQRPCRAIRAELDLIRVRGPQCGNPLAASGI